MDKEISAINIQSSGELKANNAQRKCLSHILRNCDQAIGGLLGILEDPYMELKVEDLTKILPNVCRELEEILSAAKRGTFCSLSGDECKSVSYFAGCEGEPVLPGPRHKSKLKILEI